MPDRAPPIDFRDEALPPIERRVRSTAFAWLLETGQPAPVAVITAESGVPPDQALDALESMASRGSADLDAQGRVRGIAGLSVARTSHAIQIPQGDRWTWCALDAIGIVGAVGTGRIVSTTASSVFELAHVDGGFEPDGLAIFLADGYGDTRSLQQWCPLVDFFDSVDSANLWARGQGLAGRGVAVSEIADLAAERWSGIIQGTPSRSG